MFNKNWNHCTQRVGENHRHCQSLEILRGVFPHHFDFQSYGGQRREMGLGQESKIINSKQTATQMDQGPKRQETWRSVYGCRSTPTRQGARRVCQGQGRRRI